MHVLADNVIHQLLALQQNQILKNLICNKIIKRYFDNDTIPGQSYLTDEQGRILECAPMLKSDA